MAFILQLVLMILPLLYMYLNKSALNMQNMHVNALWKFILN